MFLRVETPLNTNSLKNLIGVSYVSLENIDLLWDFAYK